MPYLSLLKTLRTALIAALLSLTLSACGQKGPLVMPPDDTAPAQTAEPAAPPEPATEDHANGQDADL